MPPEWEKELRRHVGDVLVLNPEVIELKCPSVGNGRNARVVIAAMKVRSLTSTTVMQRLNL